MVHKRLGPSHMKIKTAFAVVVLLILSGCGTPSLLVTPVSNTSALEETDVAGGSMFGGKIAIVEVEGMLANVRSGGFLQPQENVLSLFTQELNRAAADDDVKAVVLRVNSPGGTVTASDAMYQILQRFKARTHKPVVASAQEVAASGAYYVSCGADRIVAQPTSIVGSIGVIFETYNLTGTMNKLGIRPGAFKSAEHKDIGSPFRDPTPEEEQIMQGMVDEYYARFKSIVRQNRQIPDDENFKMMTDGRVFSGEHAVALGLVDRTGLLEDAVQVARDLAHAPNAKVIAYKRPYGYGGSIYALNETPQPKSNVLQLQLPEAATLLPSGFYYLWKP
jgi:protease-4